MASCRLGAGFDGASGRVARTEFRYSVDVDYLMLISLQQEKRRVAGGAENSGVGCRTHKR